MPPSVWSHSWVLTLLDALQLHAFRGPRRECHAISSFHTKNGCPQGGCAVCSGRRETRALGLRQDRADLVPATSRRTPLIPFYNPGPGTTCWFRVCALVKGFVTIPLYCHQGRDDIASDLTLDMGGQMGDHVSFGANFLLHPLTCHL